MRNVVVVGVGGLGKELVIQHLAQNDRVVSFSYKLWNYGHENYTQLLLDVSNTEKVAQTIKDNKEVIQNIDVLYYTVAAMQTVDTDNLEDFDIDYALSIYNINTLGALRVVKELLQYLPMGSTICLVSSKNGSMSVTQQFMKEGSAQMLAYNMSKSALNMAGVILYEKLKSKKISVVIVHPGSMKTEMSNFQGKNDPSVSARGIIKVVEADRENIFYSYSGERIDW